MMRSSFLIALFLSVNAPQGLAQDVNLQITIFLDPFAPKDGKPAVLLQKNTPESNPSLAIWQNGNWQPHPGWGTAIAVAPNGQPWIVNSQGEIWERRGGGSLVRHHEAPLASDIAISSQEGKVWILERGTGVLHLYNPSANTWQRHRGGGIALAVEPNGQPWVINTKGEVWRRYGGGRLEMVANAPKACDIAIGPAGHVWLSGLEDPNLFILNSQTKNWDAHKGWAPTIAVSQNGQPWLASSTGEIWARAAGNKYSRKPGSATTIGIGRNNKIWIASK